MQDLSKKIATLPLAILILKIGISNSQVYILIDRRVILIAGLVFSWEMALYAFVTLFTWGLVADYILEGPVMY